MSIAGMVLCGGASRRMGQPKEWIEIGGEPLLCRMVRIVAGATSRVIVVAGPGQSLPELPDDVAVARDPEKHHGPLVGLFAGMSFIPADSTHVFVTACDSPLLTTAVIHQIAAAARVGKAAFPRVDGAPQPLPGVYPVDVVNIIPNLLQEGYRSLRSLCDVLPSNVVEENELRQVDPQLQAFLPMNTMEELSVIKQLIS